MTKDQAIKTIKEHCYFANLVPDAKEALDMAIKALELVEEFEKAQIITGGRLNGRTYAYKCGLEDGKRKALERNNEEIFKQFKKKVFLESEDVLGNEMVDSYMITDYLAKLLGVEND